MILIVPVLNRYDLLQRMLDSIDYPLELLIIDNGGKLPEMRVPEIVTKTHILTMPNNQGVSGSWNLGIKCFPFEPYWTFTSADTQFHPGSLQKLAEASRPDCLTLNNAFPFYQSFSVGEQLVQEVGLFDESIYPIYFEDNDYERRVVKKGFTVLKVEVPVHHDNASTINDTSTPNRNGVSWPSNQAYFQNKCDTKDYSEGRWNLERIRANFWHK